MKNEKQQQARNLFFQTSLTKTEIAQLLDVNRRTIYQWSLEGDWARLKMSSQNMPTILAEKCYFLIGHLADHILMRESFSGSAARSDAETLHKLALTVNKLKKGSTLNENMEAFTYFIENIKRKDPALAGELMPHFEEYVNSRKDITETSFRPDNFTEDGWLQYTGKEMFENHADDRDYEDMMQEYRDAETTANDPANTESKP